ncbi:MAG: hypothetical protein KGL39_30700 [Patescibacteria group bacterium]|nr:hypothetical protein [Patescibacteria group bacterium]
MENDNQDFDAEAAARLSPARQALREATRRASHYRHQRTTPSRQAIRADIGDLYVEIDEALESGVPRSQVEKIMARMLGHDQQEVRKVLARELAKDNAVMATIPQRHQAGSWERKPMRDAEPVATAVSPPAPHAPRHNPTPAPTPPRASTSRDPSRVALEKIKPPELSMEQIETLDPTGEVRAALEKTPTMEPSDIGWLINYRSSGKTGISDAANKCMWIIRRKMEASQNRH